MPAAECAVETEHLMRLGTWLAPLAMLYLTACAGSTYIGDPHAYLGRLETHAPRGHTVTVCHAYNCKQRTQVDLSGKDMGEIARLMEPGTAAAHEERKAISRSIAWIERRVAAQAGLESDRGYEDLLSDGDWTQTDCIDEAANATGYLLLLQDAGLLRHHRVGHPVSKGFLLDGRYPHSTATLIEKGTEKPYSTDSWIMPNGREPIIVPLDEWFARNHKVLAARSGNPA